MLVADHPSAATLRLSVPTVDNSGYDSAAREIVSPDDLQQQPTSSRIAPGRSLPSFRSPSYPGIRGIRKLPVQKT